MAALRARSIEESRGSKVPSAVEADKPGSIRDGDVHRSGGSCSESSSDHNIFTSLILRLAWASWYSPDLMQDFFQSASGFKSWLTNLGIDPKYNNFLWFDRERQIVLWVRHRDPCGHGYACGDLHRPITESSDWEARFRPPGRTGNPCRRRVATPWPHPSVASSCAPAPRTEGRGSFRRDAPPRVPRHSRGSTVVRG